MKINKRLPGLALDRTLAVLSGRWKANILHALLDGAQRTRELEKRIVGISQKMLIQQLRVLEEHGLVSRQASSDDRQGVEYLLTPLGESLRPVLRSLDEWGTHHAEELHEGDKLLPCEAVVREREAAYLSLIHEAGKSLADVASGKVKDARTALSDIKRSRTC